MNFFKDLFKSKHQRVYDQALARGYDRRVASGMANFAEVSGFSREQCDVYVKTGSQRDAVYRPLVADNAGFSGQQRKQWLETGNKYTAFSGHDSGRTGSATATSAPDPTPATSNLDYPSGLDQTFPSLPQGYLESQEYVRDMEKLDQIFSDPAQKVAMQEQQKRIRELCALYDEQGHYLGKPDEEPVG